MNGREGGKRSNLGDLQTAMVFLPRAAPTNMASPDDAFEFIDESERREWIDWCTDHGVNVDNATAAQKHSYRVERGWEFDQLAAWNLQQMESDFSARMLHDGLDQQTIMSLLLSMRHHNDPLYVGFSEGEIAEVSATVDMERARITGLLDQFREDDE